MPGHSTKQITVRLPKELLERVKRTAVANNRTLASLIGDGLQLVIGGTRLPARTRRILPRVSKATGGLVSDAASADLKTLEEVDDPDTFRPEKSSR